MTINHFIKLLNKHNVNFDKDLAVVIDPEEDGVDFNIEESDLCIFLVASEWGSTAHHTFLEDDDYIVDTDDEFDDCDNDMGYDPYMGCFTDDC